MHRFLPGLLLIQIVAGALLWVNAGAAPAALAINVLLPLSIVTLVTAFWFASLARQLADRRHAEQLERHARERESLRVDAARDRERLVGEAARERDDALERVRIEARRERRRENRAASLKVGAAYLGTTLIGVVFLLTELLTLGLLTITTSGGVLGGYLMRWRQDRQAGRRSPLIVAGGPGGQRIPESGARVVDGSDGSGTPQLAHDTAGRARDRERDLAG